MPSGSPVPNNGVPADMPETVGTMTARRQRGVILIVALWSLTLVSLAAAAAIEASRTESRIARNVLHRAQAEAAAEAGIALGIAALIVRPPTQPWPLDGTTRELSFDNRTITVGISNELGKIDVNAAPDDVLRALFQQHDLNPEQAGALVDAIGDWRDTDDLRRRKGAEAEEYREAGHASSPRNGLFERVDELAEVKGSPRDLVARARGALTVFSRRAFVDPLTAPAAVLEALTGARASHMGDSVRRSATIQPQFQESSRRSNPGIGTTATIVDLTGRAFTVAATISSDGSQTASRQITVRFTGDRARPYWIHDWR